MGRAAWFPKFVLAPAAAAALGFWLIGPRLAGNAKIQNLVRENASKLISQPKAPEPTEAPAGPAPKVTVDIKPVAERSARRTEEKPKPRRRRVRRKKPATQRKPVVPKPAPRNAGPDPASTPGP